MMVPGQGRAQRWLGAPWPQSPPAPSPGPWQPSSWGALGSRVTSLPQAKPLPGISD